MRGTEQIKLAPQVLTALRENSGYTIEEVAKKLDVDVKKIKDIEEGQDSFSLSQIKKLSNIYRISLAALFSDTVPALPKVPDMRINREKKLSTRVYVAQRKAFYLAKKLSEITNIKSSIPTFSQILKPEELAHQFRKYLDIGLLKSEKPSKLLDSYKHLLEDKLLIPIAELPLKADDVRGFSILSDVSIVVLNESDSSSIKLFSLFHEICHLLKRSSGICSIEIEQDGGKIERECNSFAAEFLVPLDDLKTECKRFSTFDKDSITKICEIYGVSRQVIMLRLLRAGFIDKKAYERFKQRGFLKKEEKIFGRKNWEKVFLNRIGNLAIREIKKSFLSGNISYSDLFDVLNMKTKYIEKFFHE